ncbi:TolC family protein [Persicobacter diffluens]|uniref:TolC family protein n=1 Tax=Persicobacter diffluens TaxID=981 RepID=A0AAN5AL13_9BACT|nr:hypothetical protein PEDI_33210 [Persicobacter diffluens]
MRNLLLLIFMAVPMLAVAQVPEELEAYAYTHNPKLLATYKAFERSVQEAAQVKNMADPELSIGYFIQPIETRNGPQVAKLSLMQMFPWFGSYKAQYASRAAVAEARYQEFLKEKALLKVALTQAWFPLAEQAHLLALEQENQQVLTAYKTMAERQFENNKAGMVDVLRVDLMLQQSITEVEILQQQRKSLQTNFYTLLNVPEDTVMKLSDALVPLKQDYQPLDSISDQHPEIVATQQMQSSGEMALKAAHKAGMPQFKLGLDYMFVGKTPLEAPNSGQDAIMPMVAITLPIFRKKYKAKKAAAELVVEEWAFREAARRNALQQDLENTLFELTKAQKLLNLYELQLTESRHALNLLYTAYANDGKDFEEVLRMQQLLLNYEKQRVKALTSIQKIWAKYEYLQTGQE